MEKKLVKVILKKFDKLIKTLEDEHKYNGEIVERINEAQLTPNKQWLAAAKENLNRLKFAKAEREMFHKKYGSILKK